MGWAVGWDQRTGRVIGYGVPAVCEEPGCDKKIDRGLAYACGGMNGCARFFCDDHLYLVWPEGAETDDGWDGPDYYSGHGLCGQCLDVALPYPLKPERKKWLRHVLSHESWDRWRQEEPELADQYREELRRRSDPNLRT